MFTKIVFIAFAQIFCFFGLIASQSASDYILRPANMFYNIVSGGRDAYRDSANLLTLRGDEYDGGRPLSDSEEYQPQSANQPDPVSLNQFQSSEKCNSYWINQRDLLRNYGLISIPSPSPYKNNIKIQLSIGAQLKDSMYPGEIILLKSTEESVNDVASGKPLLFKVLYPVQNPLPKPTAIYLNEQLLCSEPKNSSPSLFEVTLYFSFDIESPPTLNQEQIGDRWQKTQNPERPTTEPFIEPLYSNLVDSCGVPEVISPQTTSLIVKGKEAYRGQFPWLAALFYNGHGESGFICGGSLINSRLVVTVAHCIQGKDNLIKKKAHKATFYVGKHNIEALNGEQGYVLSPVSEFIIHPDWDIKDESYDADIAIAVLTRTISYSKFIKPICIWTASSSYKDITGKYGMVAGWGKTESNAISTATPKWTEIPVVDAETCLRSHAQFARLTSKRTFCAGVLGGKSGPCNGDSGGGFVVKSGNKWYLRGIVSSALIDFDTNSCDTANFAVFTDVSMFTGWINGYMQKYSYL